MPENGYIGQEKRMNEMLQQLALDMDGFDYLDYAEIEKHSKAWKDYELTKVAKQQVSMKAAWRETEERITLYKIVFESNVGTKRLAKRTAIAFVAAMFPFYAMLEVTQYECDDGKKMLRTQVTVTQKA